jgi:hypothetical protein
MSSRHPGAKLPENAAGRRGIPTVPRQTHRWQSLAINIDRNTHTVTEALRSVQV